MVAKQEYKDGYKGTEEEMRITAQKNLLHEPDCLVTKIHQQYQN